MSVHENVRAEQPFIDNHHLGMLLFLAAEMMFFAGLIGAYLVFRLGSVSWPPVDQARLPADISGFNTLILLASGFTMQQAFHSLKVDRPRAARNWLMPALGLGVCFLGIQRYEWGRLVEQGFTLSSGAYGFTFYTMVGLHTAHILGGVIWIAVVFIYTCLGRFSVTRLAGFDLCRIYWLFVVGLWPALYGLVYW